MSVARYSGSDGPLSFFLELMTSMSIAKPIDCSINR